MKSVIGQAFSTGGGGKPLSTKHYKGFTLAEVLITLGIIGIIAAMTFPALLAKYNFLVYSVAFKKQYSVIQNTLNYLTVNNEYYDCYVTHPDGSESYVSRLNDCEVLKRDIISQLELTPVSENVKENYATSEEVRAQGGILVNSNCRVTTQYSEPYATKDGAFYMIGILGMLPGIIVDVNGEKKPNKWGYDVFWLNFSNRNENVKNIMLTDEYCSLAEKGGLLPRTILGNSDKNSDNIKWEW